MKLTTIQLARLLGKWDARKLRASYYLPRWKDDQKARYAYLLGFSEQRDSKPLTLP